MNRLLGVAVGAGLIGVGTYLAMRPGAPPAQITITGFRWEDMEGGVQMPKPGAQVYMIPKVRNESADGFTYDITVWLFRVFLGAWQTEPGCEWTKSFYFAGNEEKECRMLVTLPTAMTSGITFNVAVRVKYQDKELAMKSFGEVLPVAAAAGAASITAFRYEEYVPPVMSSVGGRRGEFAPVGREANIVLLPS